MGVSRSPRGAATAKSVPWKKEEEKLWVPPSYYYYRRSSATKVESSFGKLLVEHFSPQQQQLPSFLRRTLAQRY
jgi:hypothetical protein